MNTTLMPDMKIFVKIPLTVALHFNECSLSITTRRAKMFARGWRCTHWMTNHTDLSPIVQCLGSYFAHGSGTVPQIS